MVKMFFGKLCIVFLVFGMIEVSIEAEDFWTSEIFLKKLKEIRASDLNAFNGYNNFAGFISETTTQKPTVIIYLKHILNLLKLLNKLN